MPFKWSQRGTDIDTMLESLETDTPPEPKQNNQLTLRMMMGGKLVFESEAPPELDFLVQTAHAMTAMVVGGQEGDIREMMDRLAEVTAPHEFVEVLVRVVLSQAEFMDRFMSEADATIRLAGPVAEGFGRPVFSVDNFPPPNRPKLRDLNNLDAEDDKESATDEQPEHPADGSDAPRPGADPAGPVSEGPGES